MQILRDLFVLVVHILTDNYLKKNSVNRMQFYSQRVLQDFALLEEWSGKTKNKVGGQRRE